MKRAALVVVRRLAGRTLHTTERQAVESGDEVGRLLIAVAGGDRRAFETLYDLTAARVFGLVRRLLIDPSQSEEVTQEVFLEVWRTASRYQSGRGTGMSWLHTMARRRAIDRVRASEASRVRDLRIGLRDRLDAHDSTSEQVEARARGEWVRDALSALTERQREAVELSYFDGYTNAEISTFLHLPLGTVKTRIHDALRRLRQTIGPA